MKILVLGGDGQVGHELRGALAPFSEVRAVGRGDVDLADPAALRAALSGGFHAVVNAASFNDVDGAERDPEAALRVNRDAVRVLGEEARRRRMALVHYSTDFVFPGKAGTDRTPYTSGRPRARECLWRLEARGGTGARRTRRARDRLSHGLGVQRTAQELRFVDPAARARTRNLAHRERPGRQSHFLPRSRARDRARPLRRARRRLRGDRRGARRLPPRLARFREPLRAGPGRHRARSRRRTSTRFAPSSPSSPRPIPCRQSAPCSRPSTPRARKPPSASRCPRGGKAWRARSRTGPDRARMASHASYDAIVIGAGPNGLAAAIVLAQSGYATLLVEARETVGGGARSAELTLPGFSHDVCSAIHPMAVVSPFFRSLPLAGLGVTFIEPPAALAHPLDDGTAAVLHQSVAATAESLGADRAAYLSHLGPLAKNASKDDRALFADLLAPLRFPAHPFAMARFGLSALRSAEGLAKSWFAGPHARALFAGCAAHSFLPLDATASAAIGLALLVTGHAAGWPVIRGGSQQLSNALAAHFRALGGEIETGRPVRSLDDLPQAKALLFDVTPRQLLAICGDRLSPRYAKSLLAFRPGPGIFKLDWALDGPIPWKAAACARAGTVHLGGTLEEIAASERMSPRRPRGAPVRPRGPAEPLRRHARARRQTHGLGVLPRASRLDRGHDGPHRSADGTVGTWVSRSHSRPQHFTPARFEQYNENYGGGDISGGANDLWQVFARPVARIVPYATTTRGHLHLLELDATGWRRARHVRVLGGARCDFRSVRQADCAAALVAAPRTAQARSCDVRASRPRKMTYIVASLPSARREPIFRGGGPVQAGHPLHALGRRHAPGVRGARRRVSARPRGALADQHRSRLADADLASLVRRARRALSLPSLRLARLRSVGSRSDRRVARRARRGSRSGRRRRQARSIRAARHLAGRRRLDGVRGSPSRAGQPPRAARRVRARAAAPQSDARGAREPPRPDQADRGRLGAGQPGVPAALHEPDLSRTPRPSRFARSTICSACRARRSRPRGIVVELQRHRRLAVPCRRSPARRSSSTRAATCARRSTRGSSSRRRSRARGSFRSRRAATCRRRASRRSIA